MWFFTEKKSKEHCLKKIFIKIYINPLLYVVSFHSFNPHTQSYLSEPLVLVPLSTRMSAGAFPQLVPTLSISQTQPVFVDMTQLCQQINSLKEALESEQKRVQYLEQLLELERKNNEELHKKHMEDLEEKEKKHQQNLKKLKEKIRIYETKINDLQTQKQMYEKKVEEEFAADRERISRLERLLEKNSSKANRRVKKLLCGTSLHLH